MTYTVLPYQNNENLHIVTCKNGLEINKTFFCNKIKLRNVSKSYLRVPVQIKFLFQRKISDFLFFSLFFLCVCKFNHQFFKHFYTLSVHKKIHAEIFFLKIVVRFKYCSRGRACFWTNFTFIGNEHVSKYATLFCTSEQFSSIIVGNLLIVLRKCMPKHLR